jgi:hypothetical protein
VLVELVAARADPAARISRKTLSQSIGLPCSPTSARSQAAPCLPRSSHVRSSSEPRVSMTYDGPTSGGVRDRHPQAFDVVGRRLRLAHGEADEAAVADCRGRDVQARMRVYGRGEGIGGVVALPMTETDERERHGGDTLQPWMVVDAPPEILGQRDVLA